MNEYILTDDGPDAIGHVFETETHGQAITFVRKRYLGSGQWETARNLYMIEREEYPELHDAVDDIGPHHLVFVTKFNFMGDGPVSDDDSVWNENVDMSFDSGTSSRVVVAEERVDIDID